MAELNVATDGGAESRLSERELVAYLKAHPDFLSRHPDLLEAIELRHKSGSAVSLIERQVDMLRAKNQRLEDRLKRLMDAARDNEARVLNTQRLARTLIRAPSLAAVAAGLLKSMREDFGIDEVFVGIAAAHFKRHDIEGIHPIEADGRLARAYENFFRTRLIECGPIAADRALLLFPKAAKPILSAAVVPLEKEKSLGMLALGSADAQRFQPRQGKLFLELAADLVAASIRARI
ncbi:DUF484 family protein [Fontimonas sp. SYSU GA230001]|uniref:DUF484 family protein n=1 Tax=Fontimonas sp. SYSU GA230001 TaxID=3142450 RepID=UPI0032B47E1A